MFVPLLLLIIGLDRWYHNTINELAMANIESEEAKTALLLQQSFYDEIKLITADLKVLTAHHELELYLQDGGEKHLRSLSEELLRIMRYKPSFGQVRYLDNEGNERLRINQNNGRPVSVPARLLQNKKDRYYFEATSKLGPDGIYIRPWI